MSDSRVTSMLRWTALLACFGASAVTCLWFVMLAIDSFMRQEGSGLPRADLGMRGQLALGVGVLAAASVFVWTGVRLARSGGSRRRLAPVLPLLLVAGGMTVLAAYAPAFIHPVRGFADGVDRSLEGAMPWVTYFATVGFMAVVGVAAVLCLAAVQTARSGRRRRCADGR